MKLVLDSKRFKALHQIGVNGWELVTLLVIEETAADQADWFPLPITVLSDTLGMTPAQQSRTLKGLEARGLLRVKRVGFGDVRRHVRLTPTSTKN